MFWRNNGANVVLITGKGMIPFRIVACVSDGVRQLAMIVPRPFGRAAGEIFAEEFPRREEVEFAARNIGPWGEDHGVQIEFQYDVFRAGSHGQGSDPIVKKVVACPVGREAAFVSPDGWLYACGCASEWLTDRRLRTALVAGFVADRGAEDIWDLWQRAAVWRPFRDRRASKAERCFECTRYGSGCFGSCPIHALHAHGSLNSLDPMCPLPNIER